MMLAAIQFFRLLLLPAAQSVFAFGPQATSMLRRSGILLAALGAYWSYVRYLEKRAVDELHAAAGKIALAGAGGARMIALVVLALCLVGSSQVIELRGLQLGLLGTAYVILIAAMLEEIVFRGIIFRLLEKVWGATPAMWVQALLFSAVHYANIEAGASTWAIATTMLAGTLIGLLWAQIFILSRNLWVCGVNHAAWNFTLILSGAPLSGIEDWVKLAPALIQIHGPDWLHGGAFGPEDSIFAIGLTVFVVIALQRQIGRQKLVSARR